MTGKALIKLTIGAVGAQKVAVAFLVAIPATDHERPLTSFGLRSMLSARWIEDVDGKLMMLWDTADRPTRAAS